MRGGQTSSAPAELVAPLNPSPSDWPPVTVNVLAYNRRDDVRRTLRAIFCELDYPADRLEVIVVDNASKDETAEMVRSAFFERRSDLYPSKRASLQL